MSSQIEMPDDTGPLSGLPGEAGGTRRRAAAIVRTQGLQEEKYPQLAKPLGQVSIFRSERKHG
jgi:hypothetical protein